MSVKIIYRNSNSNYSGELGSNTRRLQFTGTARLSTLVGGVPSLKSLAKSQIEKQGWEIINFTLEDTGGVLDLSNRPISINLTVNVPDAYTNQEHYDQLARIFNSYSATFGGNVNQLQLSVSGADKPQTKPVQVIPGTNYIVNTGSNSKTGNTTDFSSSVGAFNPTNLFGIAGLSVGAVAAGLILVILLRR